MVQAVMVKYDRPVPEPRYSKKSCFVEGEGVEGTHMCMPTRTCVVKFEGHLQVLSTFLI